MRRYWGDVQDNYDEFRFFTGLLLSEQIAPFEIGFRSVDGTTPARFATDSC